MKTTILASFDSLAQTAPLVRWLNDQKIPVQVEANPSTGRLWFVPRSAAEVHVRVPAGDYEHALRLLRALPPDAQLLADALHCPDCGSLRVEYPQFTRKFVLPNFVGFLSALGLIRRQYYCEACHFTWPKPGTPEPPPRRHAAPFYFIEGLEPGHPGSPTATGSH